MQHDEHPNREPNPVAHPRCEGEAGTPLTGAPERLLSLDAYRGAIMLMMASGGLGLGTIARHYPDSALWEFLGTQTQHAPWSGCTLWDIIQPAFMFMVGVALPWSLAARRARGHRLPRMYIHAAWRALVLVLLGVFLASAWSQHTVWTFTNVLAQIGLGYLFVFALQFVRPRTQGLCAVAILFITWLAFALHSLPPADFDWSRVGIPADWEFLSGFAAHWDKNANLAATLDRWFLNLFPREDPFVYNRGGYQTLNALPSVATMIFGLLAGGLLRSRLSLTAKLVRLCAFGCAGILLGILLARVGVCPIVKRIWTPSWAIFSGGWAALILAVFVMVIEGLRCRRWAFPLVVVGLNPLAMYCMWQLMGGFIRANVRRHLGDAVFEILGQAWVPMLERLVVLIVLWLIVFWMYRRKIFLRI